MSASRRQWSGFTLVEALIVVAIVGVLASIAVVNFNNAQTRANVSKVRAELKTLSSALEVYFVDHDVYPYPLTKVPKQKGFVGRMQELTTPVAYLSTVHLLDPFEPSWSSYDRSPVREGWFPSYQYSNCSRKGSWGEYLRDHDFGAFEGFVLNSVGPDRDVDGMHMVPTFIIDGDEELAIRIIYDPTNGLLSSGDIGRWSGFPAMYGAF